MYGFGCLSVPHFENSHENSNEARLASGCTVQLYRDWNMFNCKLCKIKSGLMLVAINQRKLKLKDLIDYSSQINKNK